MRRWPLALALAWSGIACATSRPAPRAASGVTEVRVDSHLPTTFRVSRLVAVIDGDVVYERGAGALTQQPLFHGRLAQGDHQLRILVQLDVPCGLGDEPHETLVVRDSRAFDVGPNGGLVHVDVFAREPWLTPNERVRLSITLRGMRDGRALYRWSEDGLRTCGRLGRSDRSRCLVEKLVEHSRARRDVVALVCQKEKLDGIVAALAVLTESDGPMRVALEGHIERLEREAERCVGEEVAWVGQEETTWDRGGCAGYDRHDGGEESTTERTPSAGARTAFR